jgi:hypothetical protein
MITTIPGCPQVGAARSTERSEFPNGPEYRTIRGRVWFNWPAGMGGLSAVAGLLTAGLPPNRSSGSSPQEPDRIPGSHIGDDSRGQQIDGGRDTVRAGRPAGSQQAGHIGWSQITRLGAVSIGHHRQHFTAVRAGVSRNRVRIPACFE